MLTDEDKVDLINYICDSMREAKRDYSRERLVSKSHRGILHFIIDHPDICAAEIDDFFCLENDNFIQEFDRLHQKGMI